MSVTTGRPLEWAAEGPGTRRRWSPARWPLGRLVPLAVLAIVFATFSLVASNFCTVGAVLGLLTRTGVIVVLALGSLLVLTIGAIDLSSSAVLLSSGVGAMVFAGMGFPVWLSMVGGVAVGGALGAGNGLLVARLRLPSFLTTLATALLMFGLLGFLAEVLPRRPGSLPDGLGHLATVPVLRIAFRDASGATVVAFPGVSWIVVIAAGVAVISHALLTRSRAGRLAVLVGTNPEAARLSGVRVVRVQVAAFAVAGMLAGLAGVLLLARLLAPPFVPGYEMIAIECAIIGGASLSGGTGGVWGTVVGAFILSTLDMGLSMTNTDHLSLPMILNGAILLATVALDRARPRG